MGLSDLVIMVDFTFFWKIVCSSFGICSQQKDLKRTKKINAYHLHVWTTSFNHHVIILLYGALIGKITSVRPFMSTCWSVGRSVCRYFLKQAEVTLPNYYRSTVASTACLFPQLLYNKKDLSFDLDCRNLWVKRGARAGIQTSNVVNGIFFGEISRKRLDNPSWRSILPHYARPTVISQTFPRNIPGKIFEAWIPPPKPPEFSFMGPSTIWLPHHIHVLLLSKRNILRIYEEDHT